MAQPAGNLLTRLLRRLLELFRLAEQGAMEAPRELAAAARTAADTVADAVHLPHLPSPAPIPVIPVQFYGHGAFMGAAPAMLADPRWARILKFLMPDVHEDVVSMRPSPRDLIPMLENNPVMCAYGIHTSVRRRAARGGLAHARDLAAIEWDVFVDDALVHAWRDADEQARQEVAKRLVDTMVIAHASTLDLAQEALGFDQYADVRRTRKAKLGGVEAPAWFDLFSRALELVDAPDLDAATAAMADEPRQTGDDVEACRVHTFARPRPATVAARHWHAMTGRPLSLLLEMKSLRSDPALLTGIVQELNARGVHVSAVASFDPAEVDGLSGIRQHVEGETYPGPQELRFFHWAGDLQLACLAGDVPDGTHALFNGATLLRRSGDAYHPREDVVDELAELCAARSLHVGIYVQEYDCDTRAAAVLAELVTRRPDALALGFAWGGICDEACLPGDGEDRRGLGTQAMLGTLGRAKDWQVDVTGDGA
jgi:hypothetical protein